MRKFAQFDIILRVLSVVTPVCMFALIIHYLGSTFDNPIALMFSNKDFANYWIAGKLILAGETADLFGPQAQYFRHMTDAFGLDYSWHNWSYPPHYLLLIWWTGYFSYGVALWLFMVATFIPFVCATKAFAGRLDGYVIAMMAPFVVLNFWVAQNGFLTAALALGGLSLRSTRPVVAGVLIGLLTIKPQLGFLFPLLLLAERRWTVILSAIFTTLVLIALSIVFYGVEAWQGYFYNVLPYQSVVMQDLKGAFLLMLASVYGGLRSWGVEYSDAMMVHAVIAIPAALATIYGFYTAKSTEQRSILLVLGTFLITPYALIYDMGMVSAAAAMIGISGGYNKSSQDPRRYLVTIAAAIPFFAIYVSGYGLPIAPLVLFALFILVLGQSGAMGRFIDRAS